MFVITYTYTRICEYIRIHICIYIYVYLYECVCLCVCVCVCSCDKYACVFMHILYGNIYIYIYLHICIHHHYYRKAQYRILMITEVDHESKAALTNGIRSVRTRLAYLPTSSVFAFKCVSLSKTSLISETSPRDTCVFANLF